MKRIACCLLAIALAVGLMPLPAYAQHEAVHEPLLLEAASALAPASGQDYANPDGLQLNDTPIIIAGDYGYAPSEQRYGILPEHIEKGAVAFCFEGTKAPRLAIADASGTAMVRMLSKGESQLAITDTSDKILKMIPVADPPAVVWTNEERTQGVEYFPAEAIVEALAAVEKEQNDLRQVFPQANGAPVTVSRLVLTGMPELPDVSNGSYGTDKVRRLYTRPIMLKTCPDSSDSPRTFRSTAIDIFNPVFDGADIAVRYKSPTNSVPFLQFCYVTSDNKWLGWTNMTNRWGARTAIDEETGERVTFYDRDEINRLWAEQGGKGGEAFDYLYISVRPQTDSTPAGTDECALIEVVALNGAERVQLSDGQRDKVHGLSAWQIAENMRAGYNMAGHFDSNYVPENQAKDGGWGQSDLALEAHWARGTYITRQTLHNLKEAGFGAIRLPVTWFQHIYPVDDPKGDSATRDDLPLLDRYHIDRAWLERVHEVVDWCIAEGLYVIVNMHHEDWIDRTDLGTAYDNTDLPQKFQAVWTQIANEFSGYDQRLVFEDMNEPHAWFYRTDGSGNYVLDSSGKKVTDWGFSTSETAATVNRLNADFVKLMRGFGASSGHADRLLMMAHDTGNGDASFMNFVMPEDEKGLLAHSIHCYSPHDWTHYFANGAHAGEDGTLNVYTDTYKAGVDAAWENIRTRYTSQGEPVILGEFGSYYLGETEERQADRLAWMTQYATHAKELGIPMFYWRMDRTMKDADGKEYVEWSAFNEQTGELSNLSRDIMDKWFSILKDSGVRWGSNARVEEGEHFAPESEEATVLGEGYPKEIHYVANSQSDNSWRITMRVAQSDEQTWPMLEGNEVAVRFTGSIPRLLVASASWKGGWWGISPDVVLNDGATGDKIAYYYATSIKNYWDSQTASNGDLKDVPITDWRYIGLRVPTSGYNPPTSEDVKLSTTVKSVGLVHVHAWSTWKVVAPTCEEAGYEERSCSSCGARLTRNPVAAIGHAWGAWETVTPATYEATGLERRVCTNDPVHSEKRELPALVRPDQGGSGGGGQANRLESVVQAKLGKTLVGVTLGSASSAVLTEAKSASKKVTVNTVKTTDGRVLKVTSIASGAFAGSAVKYVAIGGNVESIGKATFKNCSRLVSFTLGKNVRSVGKGVFKGCKKLKFITVKTSKLNKKSLKNLLSGSNVKTIRLKGISKHQKAKVAAKYSKWLPAGVSLK